MAAGHWSSLGASRKREMKTTDKYRNVDDNTLCQTPPAKETTRTRPLFFVLYDKKDPQLNYFSLATCNHGIPMKEKSTRHHSKIIILVVVYDLVPILGRL